MKKALETAKGILMIPWAICMLVASFFIWSKKQ